MSNAKNDPPLDIHNMFGTFLWYEHPQAKEKIFQAIKQELEAKGLEKDYEKARRHAALIWQNRLIDCVQRAVALADAETRVLALIHVIDDKHERWRLVNKLADWARAQCFEDLRSMGRIKPVKKGEKKQPPLEKWFLTTYQKLNEIEESTKKAIKEVILGREPKTLEEIVDPSMSEVAEKMGLGKRNTNSGNDTGTKLLSRKIKKIRLGMEGKEVFRELSEAVKKELANERFGSSKQN